MLHSYPTMLHYYPMLLPPFGPSEEPSGRSQRICPPKDRREERSAFFLRTNSFPTKIGSFSFFVRSFGKNAAAKFFSYPMKKYFFFLKYF